MSIFRTWTRAVQMAAFALVIVFAARAAIGLARAGDAPSVGDGPANEAVANDSPASESPLAERALPPAPQPPSLAATLRRTAVGETMIESTAGVVRVVAPAAGVERTATLPVLTMLHGACSSPPRTCERMSGATDAGAWLVCPTGNVACGDAADWAGEPAQKAAHLELAISAALGAIDLPIVSDERSDVLMGFSRGAFVARDVAYTMPGRWKALVLIGAALVPDAEKLRASGIRRVVLASGDHDGARTTMLLARAKLCVAGIPARFVSLGPVWHALPEDTIPRLRDALAWVRAEAEDEVTRKCAA